MDLIRSGISLDDEFMGCIVENQRIIVSTGTLCEIDAYRFPIEFDLEGPISFLNSDLESVFSYCYRIFQRFSLIVIRTVNVKFLRVIVCLSF